MLAMFRSPRTVFRLLFWLSFGCRWPLRHGVPGSALTQSGTEYEKEFSFLPKSEREKREEKTFFPLEFK